MTQRPRWFHMTLVIAGWVATGCCGELPAQEPPLVESASPRSASPRSASPRSASPRSDGDAVADSGADSTSRSETPLIDRLASGACETATFSMGCFWCPDAVFGALDGVVRTRVGYAGGSTPRPTYEHIGDHVEAIQIDYDPVRISYWQLLEVFWKNHDTTGAPLRPQYRCAIFVAGPQQTELAVQSRAQAAQRIGSNIRAQVCPAGRFYSAESYHQKYHLRQHVELIEEINTIYAHDDRIMNSTLCARLNAIVAGYGDASLVHDEMASYGMSPKARQRVLELVEP